MRLLFSPLFILLFVFSCTYAEVNVETIHEEEKIDFVSLQKNGVMVESAILKGNEFLFSFSDGSSMSFSQEVVDTLSIIDDSQSISRNALVIEGYEDWSFHLDDALDVVLPKKLFYDNPDAVLRGINHRGYSSSAPENTIPAFKLSKLKGFNYVEADVRFTKDGIPVLMHDLTVDRTSNGNGFARDLLWDEIRKLDFGSWMSDKFAGTRIPSLTEFCELCRDIRLKPYIELKTGSKEQIEKVISIVEACGLSKTVVYISFSAELLNYVSEKDHAARLGYLAKSPLTEEAINTVTGLKTESNYVFIDSSDYSNKAASLCQDYSIPLEVWTIDSEKTILSLSPYITGVTSNNLHAGRIRSKK